MAKAVLKTFENRHSSFNEIVAFEEGFAEDPLRQSRWNAFVKKKKALLPITLSETIILFQKFLQPVADAIVQDTQFTSNWSYDTKLNY